MGNFGEFITDEHFINKILSTYNRTALSYSSYWQVLWHRKV